MRLGGMSKYKSILVATLLLCFTFQNNVMSQKQNITLDLKNKQVSEVFKEIKKQTGYSVIYNSGDLNPDTKINVVAKKEPLDTVLKRIFSTSTDNLSYEIKDNYIVVNKVVSSSTSTTPQINQQKIIKGTVVDDKNEPLIGVNVIIQGTTTGSATDLDGNFTLSIPNNESQIVVSYIGYMSQQVNIAGKSNVKVIMKEDGELLEELVVTALGIKREAKSLTYNVQEVKANEVTMVKDASFINSLAGKVAGVTINQSANGIGGSTRVVMRGTKSLYGDNNALYVVDGIPLSSMRSEQPLGAFEMPDGGDSDGISSINPDDIESMSVLTGAAAAALYGAQGANGVILITTKRGEEGKLKVSLSNDTQFLSPFIMPKFQNTYGRKAGSYESWGNKLSNPSSYNPEDFFQTGFTVTNSMSVTSGSDRNQTYFSAASINAESIMPNSEFDRFNFSIRNTSELIKDKLTLDVGASYIIQKNQNMTAQGQAHNPLLPLYLFPPSDDIDKYKVYERYNPERNFNTQFWPFGEQGLAMQNPWWIVNREMFNNNKQRYMFTGNLNWKINSWSRATGRVRVDNSEDIYTRKISASSSKLFASDYGNYLKLRTQFKNVYADAIVNMDKSFDDFSINGNVGVSLSDEVAGNRTGYEGHLVRVPNLFTFENIDRNDPETNAIESEGIHTNTQSVFATAQLSYKSLVFIDVTARNDWSSTFAFTDNEKSGFFYPSVGLSFLPSEFINNNDILSFMKVRASYSEVGNAPKPYVTSLSYSINNGNIENLPAVPATFLKPERTKAFETGMNLRLLQNRINLDVTYYNSNTYNQFFTLSMPPSSGYKEFYVNGGDVNNYGIEAMLGYKESFGKFNWRSNVTFTINRNKVNKLLGENVINPITNEQTVAPDHFDIVTTGSYKQRLVEGGSIGDIYVTGLKTDHDGNVYVNPQNGAVEVDSENWIKAGNVAPKANLGWNNTFSYKGISLNLLVDARIGGIAVSATQALMDRFGTSQSSADARDDGGATINGGLVNPESYYSVVGGGETGSLAFYTYSATNIRLREASINYTFSDDLFNNKIRGLTISLLGKNLFMFRNKAPFDPELASSTGTYYQGIDYFMQPSLRNIGFSLKFEL